MEQMDEAFLTELDRLAGINNLRVLPEVRQNGKWIEKEGARMLNLSSNDYLGLASDVSLKQEFMSEIKEEDFLFSSSSSFFSNVTVNSPLSTEMVISSFL